MKSYAIQAINLNKTFQKKNTIVKPVIKVDKLNNKRGRLMISAKFLNKPGLIKILKYPYFVPVPN